MFVHMYFDHIILTWNNRFNFRCPTITIIITLENPPHCVCRVQTTDPSLKVSYYTKQQLVKRAKQDILNLIYCFITKLWGCLLSFQMFIDEIGLEKN